MDGKNIKREINEIIRAIRDEKSLYTDIETSNEQIDNLEIRINELYELNIDEKYETSALKSVCCINSLVQDLNEMKIRRIGIYKFQSESFIEESSDFEL
ncbi:hypothetical protein P3W45_001270 [Vairimorpha bombi]